MRMRNVVVQKYGGSSVATGQQLRRVAQRVRHTVEAGHPVVVVTSAQGDTTDALVRQARDVLPDPTQAKREYDALLATGENKAVALLAMTLIAEGLEAISFTGPQAGILTDNLYTKARILDIDTRKLRHELAGEIPLVGGLLNRGRPWGGGPATLGRARYRYHQPFLARAGATVRVVAELGPAVEARAILPGGQSGHPLSAHYADQFLAWLTGALEPLPRRPEDVPGPAERLVPAADP